MKKNILLFFCLALLPACGGRSNIMLTSEPSIERAFDIIGGTSQGKPLIKFLYNNPVRFEYSNTAGMCHKFSLKKGLIFLPGEMKSSDLILALAAARAAYIYRLYATTGLGEIISEEEELATLFQARLALEINMVNADFEKAKTSAEIKSDFCTYIMESSRNAMAQARREALTPDENCQRPLETLENQRIWLEKLRQAIDEDNFNQLLYERDMQRVRRGAMPISEAMKNDAKMRALPTYETYRFQRVFYDDQKVVFSDFEKIYRQEISDDDAWRRGHREELDRARGEFSTCNLPGELN